MRYRIEIRKRAIIWILLLTIFFTFCFGAGYYKVQCNVPSIKLLMCVAGTLYLSLIVIGTNVVWQISHVCVCLLKDCFRSMCAMVSDLYKQACDLCNKTLEKIRHICQVIGDFIQYIYRMCKSFVTLHVGHICTGVIILLVLCVALFLSNKYEESITVTSIMGFLYSLLATISGIFVASFFLHPRIVLPEKLTIDKNNYLKIRITNKTFFKVYNVNLYLDMCRENQNGSHSYKKMALYRPSLSYMQNRLVMRENAYSFRSDKKFQWDPKYSSIRVRVTAVHSVSNVMLEFERLYGKNYKMLKQTI